MRIVLRGHDLTQTQTNKTDLREKEQQHKQISKQMRAAKLARVSVNSQVDEHSVHIAGASFNFAWFNFCASI